MQKHDAKNAQGTSGTQQPSKKVDSDLDHKKPTTPKGDRINKTDDDFNSPKRSK
ncbi:MAG: hypothetical protein H7318_03970 [Oligoflexus sp.]|nr:hypothetical protein [Oligoflexus sp.]